MIKKCTQAFALLLASIMLSSAAQAQLTRVFTGSSVLDNLSDVRVVANAPASVAGLKKATIATWGNQAAPPVLNVQVVRGQDSLAATLPLTNPSAINGKICLLFRGGSITFAQKAAAAETAGAVAVIIVNNVPGDPVGMGNTGTATRNIPVIMISNSDGVAINNAIIGGATVTMSIGKWSMSVAHDLGILRGFQSMPHALCMPLSQLAGTGAAKPQYKNFVGGAILNYSLTNETNISVDDTVSWTPTGGSASNVHTGTYAIPDITNLDSFEFGFGAASSAWSLPAPANTGVFKYKYALKYASTDGVPQDNIYEFNQYVTDSIFCKGAYDMTAGRPNVSLGIRPASNPTQYSYGPTYYLNKGRYYARKMQYNISKDQTTAPTLNGEEAYALIFKWVDGSNSQPRDSMMQGSELRLVGLNRKTFTITDSSGMYTVNITDVNNRPVVLDSNSWYWTPVQVSGTCFVGVDESTSFFTRCHINRWLYNNLELPLGQTNTEFSQVTTNSATIASFMFGGSSQGTLIDSTAFDRFYYIPNIALHLSKDQAPPAGVENVQETAIGSLMVAPNPAVNAINATLDLKVNSASVQYRLLDQAGRVVYREDRSGVKNDRISIPTQNLSNGIYYLTVFTEAGHTFEKVVVQH